MTNAADNLMSQGDSDNSSNKDKTQQEISSVSIAENNDQTNQDWWKISCQTYCYICKTENAIDESTNKYECAECGEEQYIAQPCCADPCAKELFSVSVSENFVSCPICKSSMVRRPCCDKFQPSLQLDNNVYDCVECSKYTIKCVCQHINPLRSNFFSQKFPNRSNFFFYAKSIPFHVLWFIVFSATRFCTRHKNLLEFHQTYQARN